MFESTHPADDARMRAMVLALRLLDGFKGDADAIEAAWQEFTSMMGYKAEPEYYQCYPDTHLVRLVGRAKDGVEGIGIRLADSQQEGQVRFLLNEAWNVFWKAPSSFQAWEAEKVAALRKLAA